MAEFLATAIIPIVMVGLARLSERKPWAFPLTAIAYGALICTHLPLALLASLFLFGPYALLLGHRDIGSLTRQAAALALGVALAAIYLVPAFALASYRDTASLWVLPTLRPSSWSLWYPGFADLNAMRDVLIIAGFLAIPLIVILLRVRSGWAAFGLLCIALGIGVVPALWSLPVLKSVQFPFRLMPIAEFAFATAVARAPAAKSPLALSLLPLAMTLFLVTAPALPPGISLDELAHNHPDVPENLPPGPRPYTWPSRWALNLAVRHHDSVSSGGITTEPTLLFPGMAGALRRDAGAHLPRTADAAALLSRHPLREAPSDDSPRAMGRGDQPGRLAPANRRDPRRSAIAPPPRTTHWRRRRGDSMKTVQLLNYERDRWVAGDGNLAEIPSAIDGTPVATTGSGGVDFGGMLRHAREVGGPALRKLTFHERARMIKALGLAIMARKEELYELNYLTGATRKDGWIDIEGGAGTLFSFSSKGRRELPDAHVLLDGPLEGLSKNGTFVGQHIYTPLQGAAVHINAFNFPVWGMLEKLAPTLLAGVPAIVKPASATAYLAEAAFRIMIEAQILPPGAIQLIVGGVGDLFDHLTGRTSSASLARRTPRSSCERTRRSSASRSGSSRSRTASTPRCLAPTRRPERRSSTSSSRKSRPR